MELYEPVKVSLGLGLGVKVRGLGLGLEFEFELGLGLVWLYRVIWSWRFLLSPLRNTLSRLGLGW